MPKFEIKNNLFVYLWAGILRNYCDIWNQRPRICRTGKICTKIKVSKFETKKTASFGYFWAGTSKNYCRISIQIPRICLTEKCHAKIKTWNQKCLIWVFYAAVWKSSCHIWGQHFQICLILKFHATIKMSNFGTKNSLLRYFWTGIWKW